MGQSRDSCLLCPIRGENQGRKSGKRYDLGSKRSGEHLRYITKPWFQDDLVVVGPKFQASRVDGEGPAGLLLAWPTPILTAGRFSARALWGSKIAMVQTAVLLGPSVRLVSPKVELYKDAEDSFSWRLIKVELPHLITIAAHRAASKRGVESRYSCRVNFDGGWRELFVQHLLQKWQNHWHFRGDRF